VSIHGIVVVVLSESAVWFCCNVWKKCNEFYRAGLC